MTFDSSLLLFIVTFLPLLGAFMLLAMPREEENLHRGTGLAITLITFICSLFLIPDAATAKAGTWSAVLDWKWIEGLGIHFKLGLDGISLFLVLLATFLMPVVVLSAWRAVTRKVREFIIALLVLETGMIGAFVALDLFVFYLFWEVMLVPMYLIIGIWGGDRRMMASIKFVLYTLTGSLLMLVAIIYLYVQHHQATGVWSFDYDNFRNLVLTTNEQVWCFLAFALAFCIKVPLFPLHTWLPDAHVEAPTAGSVILAGVLLKFGTYGLLRFAMPLFPAAVALAAPYLTVLSLIGIVYGSLVAWSQTDVKKMIAYSSVAHLGFVVLGLMAWNGRAVDGAMLQNLAHGVSTPGLFLSIGVLYERRHTRRIDEFGGLWAQMPRFATMFLIITLASIGLPGLSGFVAEFLVLLGTFDAYRVWRDTGMPFMFGHPKVAGAIAATGVILGAVYMLFMFQRVMFGPNNNPKNKHLPDLTAREVVVFLPILLGVFWLGVRPTTFLDHIDPAVRRTLSQFQQKYAEAPESGKTPRMLVDAPNPAQGAGRGPGQAQPAGGTQGVP
ncbi:MAG TPA: NADH-quinone oxidoreductase subunit M [Polyangia bacterium]|jgi:NADH-quinone oxidoreductase subunit M|nr:NADH-quinone oxidoreductase subunit M [Polyangia bacterium]